MARYAARVEEHGRSLPRPPAVCGWSMGGLAALQAAARLDPAALVLIEPSPPAEVQEFAPEVRLTAGVFDPEQVYGRFPDDIAARPESQLARDERTRGIAVPAIPCRSLVVYGREFADDRGRAVARLYGSREAAFPGLDHWGLVRSPAVRAAVRRFLAGG